MAFADDMIPPLRALASKLIDLEMYDYLSSVADLLAAFKSGNWPKLSYEDQKLYIEKMKDTFHIRGMGDTPISSEPEYDFIVQRLDSEFRALVRKLR